MNLNEAKEILKNNGYILDEASPRKFRPSVKLRQKYQKEPDEYTYFDNKSKDRQELAFSFRRKNDSFINSYLEKFLLDNTDYECIKDVWTRFDNRKEKAQLVIIVKPEVARIISVDAISSILRNIVGKFGITDKYPDIYHYDAEKFYFYFDNTINVDNKSITNTIKSIKSVGSGLKNCLISLDNILSKEVKREFNQ